MNREVQKNVTIKTERLIRNTNNKCSVKNL